MRAAWCRVCLTLAWLGAAAGPAEERAPEASLRPRPYVIDLANRTVVRPIEPELAEPESQKFVELEVGAVENARRLPLSFEVFYRDEQQRKVRLGSFALFPPDNPGRFIVPTGGRVRRKGAIVVSLVVLRELRPDDRVRVVLERIAFRMK
jgi:hypothetical protein